MLFRSVIFLVTTDLSDEEKPFMKPVDHELLKWLGSCTLVCRYWASLLRKVLFSRAQLHCENDFHRLLSLLSTSSPVSPSLQDCLKMVAVSWLGGRENDLQAQWYYRLPDIQAHASNTLTWAFSMHDLVDRHVVDDHFLIGPLPRTLLGSAFRIEYLKLSYVRLSSVRDLIRAVGALPWITVLRCTRLLFDDDEIPAERVLTGSHRMRDEDSDLTVQVQRSGGAEMEKQLMLKLISELYYGSTDGEKRPLWDTFHKLVMTFQVPTLTDANIFGTPLYLGSLSRIDCLRVVSADSCLFSDELCGNFMLPTCLSAADGAAVLWTIDDGQTFTATNPTTSVWTAFESALIFKGLPLMLKVDDIGACRAMLDAVFVDGLFARLLGAGLLALEHRTYLPHDIFAQQALWRIDGRSVLLKPSQQLDLLLCGDDEERMAYVRKLAMTQSST